MMESLWSPLDAEIRGCCQAEETHWEWGGKQRTGTALKELTEKFQGEVWVENETAQLRNNVMVFWHPKQSMVQHQHSPVLQKKAFFGFQSLLAGLGGWNPNFSDYFV